MLPLELNHKGDPVMGCTACLAWEKDNVHLFFCVLYQKMLKHPVEAFKKHIL